MKTFVTSMMLAATALTLAACSAQHDADTATINAAGLSNDDFASGQENLTDEATFNAALDNAADPVAGASVTNATLGNEAAGNTL
jgi:hypothetical protein